MFTCSDRRKAACVCYPVSAAVTVIMLWILLQQTSSPSNAALSEPDPEKHKHKFDEI